MNVKRDWNANEKETENNKKKEGEEPVGFRNRKFCNSKK